MTAYEKGRAFEYKIKKLFTDAGYTVTRAAGSHSPFDLIAVDHKGKEVWFSIFMQCKCHSKESPDGKVG